MLMKYVLQSTLSNIQPFRRPTADDAFRCLVIPKLFYEYNEYQILLYKNVIYQTIQLIKTKNKIK